MHERESEAHQLANEYVIQIEDAYVTRLFIESADADKHSDKCGCFQCRKWSKSVSTKLANELDRISPTRKLCQNE